MKKYFACFLLTVAMHGAFAGPYSDALARKLVASTTSEEKAACVRWMFVAMAAHPDLKGMSSVTPEQKEAVKYEGNSAIESAFQVFGQIAARELFSNPDVSKGLGELQGYMDTKALQKALGDKPGN
jgi:hypothetical protein